MKNLAFAFFAALVAILISYFMLVSVVGLDATIASSISSVILGGLPFIHQTLEKSESKNFNSQVSKFVSFEGFTYPFKLILLYAFLLSVAVLNTQGFMTGFVVGFFKSFYGLSQQELDLRFIVAHVSLTITFFYIPFFFFLGRWVGIKASSNGILVIILAVFLSETITSIINYSYFQTIFKGLLFSVIGLIGYWLGRKQQLVAYMSFLMARVPKDNKSAIIELAFEAAINEAAINSENKTLKAEI